MPPTEAENLMNRKVVSISALLAVWASSSAFHVVAQGGAGIPSVIQNVIDRQTQSVQEQALDRVQQQTVQQTSQQVLERVQNQAAEQVVEQAVGQVADQAVQQAVQQTVQQTQNRLINQADAVGSQTLERVQAQTVRVPDGAGRLLSQNQEQAQDQQTGLGLEILPVPPEVIPPPVYPSPLSQLPERLPINDNDGNEAFVEIRIQPDIRILEREWVMLINADQRQVLINQAPQLMRFLQETIPFEALNSFLFRFRVPPDLDSEDAVQELLPESLHNLVDRNHVYSAESEASPAVSVLTLPMMSVCNRQLSVGMIDSAVREDHPAFAPGGRRTPLVTRAFIDQNLVQPSGHGTAVAGVMIGHTQGLQPLLPNATLYSASVVYAQDAYNQGATVLNLMRALDWLITVEDLQVINISMTGPPNRLLAQGVAAAQRRGKVIVAAAGNAGPFAPALYPAAYEGVITTTAVAVDTSIYRWANQGEHVDFAALGVSVVTARGDGTVGAESGTSMAAPIVSSFFACEMAAQGGDVARALQNLRARAIDLGTPGRDPVFGHGLLHP